MNAIYGTFNIEMLPVNTINVTDKIKHYIKEDILEIPNQINFRELFGTDDQKKKNYLQVTANGRTYSIADDDYTENITIDLSGKSNKIKIVYYIYISANSNWRAIISGQLFQLKSFGILSEADLYIHITESYNHLREINKLIKSITPDAIITSSVENQYEYPAIKLLHDLATQHPDNKFLYFHSKGMTHNLHSRSLEEIMLFTKTFEKWRRNLQFLDKAGIEKVGLFPSKEGWIWYNFWYANGKYLSGLLQPEISDFRYYYEAWLALEDKGRIEPSTNCYNLFEIKNTTKNYFSAIEADIYKENIMEKLFSHAETKEIRLVRSSFMIYGQLKVDSFLKRFKRKNLVNLFKS
ncbi:hypothetical protein [Mucilaginibacter sp. FT3.2]|uniref:hypothetical protein n=1 Tax=Mucilaginibacter sp. FT3.2 TaxID=2723090 RepID=UPI0016102A86|nr:hypothetical protein [Mucilaginibacter sp. FT3.2]MBB6230621.1 hypothetical protein [Mucilaginibacter sp. FT3.2]